MRDAATRLPRAHGGWPRWARITAPVAAGVFVLSGVACAAEAKPSDVDLAERASTTTTVERTTTTRRPTTTERPTTTTTRPPSTTAPPTTAAPSPPPPPPPPTVAPAPAPAPPSNCNRNYSGCVPNDSDVDCAGGSGNGPSYVSGPVQIIGGDPYGLDNDNDGVGCE